MIRALAFVLLSATPAAAQEVFLGQVDGPCIDGQQWIGGFVGAFLEDGHGHATLRRCGGGSGPPLIRFRCDHRSDSLTVDLDVPRIAARVPTTVEADIAGLSFRFAAIGSNATAWPHATFTMPRDGHPLLAALAAGFNVRFDAGAHTATFHLSGSSAALDAMQRACIRP